MLKKIRKKLTEWLDKPVTVWDDVRLVFEFVAIVVLLGVTIVMAHNDAAQKRYNAAWSHIGNQNLVIDEVAFVANTLLAAQDLSPTITWVIEGDDYLSYTVNDYNYYVGGTGLRSFVYDHLLRYTLARKIELRGDENAFVKGVKIEWQGLDGDYYSVVDYNLDCEWDYVGKAQKPRVHMLLCGEFMGYHVIEGYPKTGTYMTLDGWEGKLGWYQIEWLLNPI